MDAEKLPVETIPVTDKLKGQIRALIDHIVDSFGECHVDDDIASGIDGAMRSIVGTIEPSKLGAKDAVESIFMTIGINSAINDFISALEVVLKEIRGNKVLYENRHVIVAAIKDSFEKDERPFIVIGDESFVGDAADMAKYTGNVQFIREYKKMVKKFKKGAKKHGR